MPAGSAYQGLILPAPRRSAPQRVGSQAPTLPPILVPHSASTTYRPGAIQSHFSPSQAPSHGSYSGAGLPPSLAPSSAGGASHRAASKSTGLGAKLSQERLALVLALLHGSDRWTPTTANEGVAAVTQPATTGVWDLVSAFNPKTAAPQIVGGGNLGGMYLPRAQRPDSLPPHAFPTQTEPIPNMQKVFRLSPQKTSPLRMRHSATA